MATDLNTLAADQMHITVVYSHGPRHSEERTVLMPVDTQVCQAIASSQFLQGLTADAVDALAVSVWGLKAGLQDKLRDGDRIEILRDLRVDPKVARRERFAKQGAKAAGLFSRRRAGGKAGY